MSLRSWKRIVLAIVLASAAAPFSAAQEAKPAAVEKTPIAFAEGKVTFTPPAEWKQVKPKNFVIQYEFSAPASEEKADKLARITFSAATGSIQDNLDRWFGQFVQPDGSSTKEKFKPEVFEVQGQKVHMVDITGTYKDGGGAPFAPQANPVMRENYRMLAAAVETAKYGKIFVKVTGPADTLEKLKEGFRKTLDTMEVQK